MLSGKPSQSADIMGQAIQQYLVTKCQLEDVEDDANLAESDDPVSRIVNSRVEEATRGEWAAKWELEILSKRIKELELEKEAEERMERLGVACRDLSGASASVTAMLNSTDSAMHGQKGRLADFEDVAKHAQHFLDLHDKLKKEEFSCVKKLNANGNSADKVQEE